MAADLGGTLVTPLEQITCATKKPQHLKAHIGNAVLVTDVHRCAGHVPFQARAKVAY